MNRKILKIGPATLAISLPTKWVKKFGVKKGQELDVEDQGNRLIIGTKSVSEKDSSVLDIKKLGSISPKIMGMLYKAGYNQIKVIYNENNKITYKGKTMSELELIKDTLDHLNGMQLWEISRNKNENYVVAVESSKVNPKEFNNVLNKLNLHLVGQAEQVLDLISGKRNNLYEIYLTERLVNQSADFCTRILVSFGHSDYNKSFQYYEFVTKLESIADKYHQIALYFENKSEKNIIPVIKKTIIFLNEIASLYRKFDYERIIHLTKEVENEIESYEDKIKRNWGGLISHNVSAILTDIYEIIELLYFLNYDYFATDNKDK